MNEELEQLKLDPTERAFFIEKTGVIMRWILIFTCSIIQLVSPVIPFLVFFMALPLSILYNALLNVYIFKKREYIVLISRFSAVIDIVVSVVLIYFAGQKDIYLWYFVLLVAHAARFGFIGSIISPIIFSVVYIAGLYLRGLEFPLHTLAIRSTFFIITGIVSGYLAREEHRRFINILNQQKQIFIARQKRKELRELLQRYVSYNVVEELMRHPEELKMGGSKKKVSVLFSDIQGFTELLASKDPEAIVRQLNEYLTEMSNIIFNYNGMVDKFVGDAVIGIFGAVSERPEDSEKAVRCALAMQKKLSELQEKWKKDSAPVFHSRIAVNTGPVIMGNIGSPRRMDFTAIGDPVNIASRLQAVAQTGAVVISSETYGEVKDIFLLKSLGKIQLKGKSQPIEVFEVTGEKR